MKRIILYVLTSVVLFASGLATSWYFMIQGAASSQQENPADTRPAALPLAAEVPANLDAPDLPAPDSTELPVPVRGQPLTAEEIFRYGASIRGQYEAMVRRQQEVERDASRLKLMHEDIRGSREELDGLEAKVTGLVTMAERLLARLDAGMAQLEDRQKALEQADVTGSNSSQPNTTAQLQNTKRISEIISGMPEQGAAEYLKQLSNDGKLDVAGQVLHDIEPRDAAKILAALQDPVLTVQLTEELRKHQLPTKKR